MLHGKKLANTFETCFIHNIDQAISLSNDAESKKPHWMKPAAKVQATLRSLNLSREVKKHVLKALEIVLSSNNIIRNLMHNKCD